jgi:peptidoglycan/LPS O-acetylase OafA/YrhL
MTTTSKTQRISALDYTKGALVIIMVLYHWLNYFVGPQGNYYRYLRFLTPSFIFITGFLITNVFISRYGVNDSRLALRLVQRGLKILAVFIVLNMGISLLAAYASNGAGGFEPLSIQNLIAVYVTGNVLIDGVGKAAAFHILVPISYLLLLSAALLVAVRFYKYVFYVVCVVLLLCSLILDWYGLRSEILELLTFGLFGVVCGYIPIRRINEVIRHKYALILAYACYAGVITVLNVVYPLGIVGVCLSLLLLYLLGSSDAEPGPVRRTIILLGNYSLLGYIAQIAILQVLRRLLQHTTLGPAGLALSLFGALVLTIVTVKVVDSARMRATGVDRLYKAVFA